jgi:hypothetical protein
MKLLLEAWKGYLASTKPIPQQDPNYPEEEEDVYWRSAGEEYDDEEEPPATIEDLETSYYGKDRRDLTRVCKLLRLNYTKNAYLNDAEIERFARVLGKEVGLNIKFMGAGAFRATYTIGNDLVMKISSNGYDQYTLEMNKNDFQLGTDPEIGNIFPRAYLHDYIYEWILLEKVTPIKKNHEAAKYFENSILGSVEQLSEDEKNDYFNLVMLSLEDGKRGNFYNLIHHSELANRFSNKKEIPTADMLKNYMLKNSHTYRSLYKAIKKYKIDVSEIRFDNIGYASDGRFVLLDSSIF